MLHFFAGEIRYDGFSQCARGIRLMSIDSIKVEESSAELRSGLHSNEFSRSRPLATAHALRHPFLVFDAVLRVQLFAKRNVL